MTEEAKKTTKKVVIGLGSLFVGSLVFYVTKECIKEYNNVIEENDKLKEYIANELIKHDCKVDTVLSNGKHIVHEVEKQVIPKIVKTYEKNGFKVTEFDNGMKMLSAV